MKKKILLVLFGLGLLGVASTVNAELILNLGGCDYTSDPSGTGTCGGTGADIANNSMIMTFTQSGAGEVQMTLDTTNMAIGLGKITDVWFNVDGYVLSELTFAYLSGDVQDPTVSAGGNVGNLGDFILNYDYETSGSLGAFYYGQKTVYKITGDELQESDFGVLNSDGFAAAFHMNITGNGESGHYTVTSTNVPEPASMFLFGTGIAGLLGVARRRNKK